jgi:hypothetical protein
MRVTSPLSSPLALAFAAVVPFAACSDGTDPIDPTPDAGVADVGGDASVGPPDTGGGPDANPVPPPQFTSVRPAEGSVEGGTLVTLRGQLFEAPVEVFFDGVQGTNATLLDSTTVQVVSPPGESAGPVDVTLQTPGGEATLVDRFRYLPVLEVTSVEPARIPDEGGALLTIRGRGFTEDTLVLLDRQPLGGWTRVSDTEMTGVAPPLAPGRPELRVLTPDNDARRSDLVIVYATPEVTAVEPPVVDAAGQTRVALAGSGLEEVEEVRFNGVRGALVAVQPDRIEVLNPPVVEGEVTVELLTPDVRYTVPVPLFAVGPSPDFAVFGVSPGQAIQGAADVVRVAGRGFAPPVDVTIGGASARVVDVTATQLDVEVPAVLGVGSYPVEVTSAGESAAAPAELAIVAPLDVLAVSPESAPAGDPLSLTVVGAGFVDGVRVTVGGFPLQNPTVLDPATLTGTLDGGAGGTVDVVVRAPDGRTVVLENGFTFEEDFEVIRVEPSDGSIAGNTYVSVFGRGLRGPVAVDFGGEAGLLPGLENGSILAVRAPAGDIGFVDLTVQSGEDELVLEDGYAYFNPRLITGGGFGGPIEGDVNVAVVDGAGEPLAGAVVQLGYDADPRYRETTDGDGLATVSWPELQGPQTVTAGANGIEFTTFTAANARNLTMILQPHPQPPPEDQPIQPCPENEPPRIRGRVFGLKSVLDPDQDPNIQPVVTITYSQPNVFTPNPSELVLPGQTDTITEEGEIYEIVTGRAGTVTVFALLQEVDVNTGQVVARRRLGLRRSVPVVPNEVTEGADIELSIELDQEVDIRLDEPPRQSPGPSINAVFPFLNVGSDGVIAFPPQAATDQTVTLTNMPRLAQSEFIYMAGSLTQAGAGLGAPFSLAIQPSAAEPDEGADVGPFLQPPQNITPKAGQVLNDGVIRYEREGLVPDLSITSFNDSIFIGSQCCVDLNQNGTCEDGEPVQSGGGPVPFTRWSIYGPGDRLSIELPRLPRGFDAFNRPQFVGYGIQQARVPRFTFQEFTYAQFSPLLWESWTSVSSSVVIKEITD